MQRVAITQDDKRGFTLIELLVVILVIGVLGGIGVYAFNPFETAAQAHCDEANLLITQSIDAMLTSGELTPEEWDTLSAEQQAAVDSCDGIITAGPPGGGGGGGPAPTGAFEFSPGGGGVFLTVQWSADPITLVNRTYFIAYEEENCLGDGEPGGAGAGPPTDSDETLVLITPAAPDYHSFEVLAGAVHDADGVYNEATGCIP